MIRFFKFILSSLLLLALLAVLPVLCFVDLRAITNTYLLPYLPALKPNLDFLAQLLSNYGALFFTLLLTAFIIYIGIKFKPSLSEFSFAGVTFSLRKPDIRKRIGLFLNTRRSIFYFLEGYDNINDVMKSWYEILGFIRDQINKLAENSVTAGADQAVDSKGGNAENATPEEKLFTELNAFLTKYQSDYRRYYTEQIDKAKDQPHQTAHQTQSSVGQTAVESATTEVGTMDDRFLTFDTIQRSYPKYRAIVDDIEKINTVMKAEYGPYFGVHFRKWEAVIDKIVGASSERSGLSWRQER